MGCTMEITTENEGIEKKVINIKDNGCKRGTLYAQKELLNPTRTLTTTIAIQGSSANENGLSVVPVKSVDEIPKNMLLQCMEVIKRAKCKVPIKRGDVLIYDILGTGINIIACADVE